jgi:hypothetical protein
MYLDKSGIGGQGGTDERRTYLLISFSRQGGHTAAEAAALIASVAAFWHVQSDTGFPHVLHEEESVKPSLNFALRRIINPTRPTIIKRSALFTIEFAIRKLLY